MNKLSYAILCFLLPGVSVHAQSNHPLTPELEALYDKDQAVRMELMPMMNGKLTQKERDSLFREIKAKDSINLARVTEILDKHGWLGPEEVGEKANNAIFLVIQHADLETQKQYVPLLREAVEEGKAKPDQLALTEDRIAMREGRKQRYGSQIGMDPETGKMYVFPLEDPDQVDERRAGVGLEPMSEYLKKSGDPSFMWDTEAYKKNLPKYEKWHQEFLEMSRGQ